MDGNMLVLYFHSVLISDPGMYRNVRREMLLIVKPIISEWSYETLPQSGFLTFHTCRSLLVIKQFANPDSLDNLLDI